MNKGYGSHFVPHCPSHQGLGPGLIHIKTLNFDTNMSNPQAFKRPRSSNNGGDHHDESSDSSSGRQQHYKTRLCNNFNRGCCRYGEACLYAHSFDELCSNNTTLGFSSNNSSNHGFRNSVFNMFSRNGMCAYGERCRFRHVMMPRSSTRDLHEDDEESVKSVVGLEGDDNGGRQFGHAVPRKLCSYTTMGTKYSKTCTTKEMQGWDGKFDRKFWYELVRMSRIHADWIEEIPLVHGQLQ